MPSGIIPTPDVRDYQLSVSGNFLFTRTTEIRLRSLLLFCFFFFPFHFNHTCFSPLPPLLKKVCQYFVIFPLREHCKVLSFIVLHFSRSLFRKKFFRSVPIFICRLLLFQEDDEFLIIGCDGLWDVFGAQEAVEFCRNLLLRTDDPQLVSTKKGNGVEIGLYCENKRKRTEEWVWFSEKITRTTIHIFSFLSRNSWQVDKEKESNEGIFYNLQVFAGNPALSNKNPEFFLILILSLSGNFLFQVCERLVMEAYDRGSTDNISVLLITFKSFRDNESLLQKGNGSGKKKNYSERIIIEEKKNHYFCSEEVFFFRNQLLRKEEKNERKCNGLFPWKLEQSEWFEGEEERKKKPDEVR